MWKRQREEPPVERTPSAPPVRPAATPEPRPEPPAPKREASIGKSVVVNGDIYSKEDMHVDGKVQGKFDMPGNRLTIGANGKVEASIKAREVVVLGAVQGDIEAGDRIVIRKDAHLEGNLKSASISIEDGSYFKGSIDIVRPAPVSAPPPSPKPPVQQSMAASQPPLRSTAPNAPGTAPKPPDKI